MDVLRGRGHGQLGSVAFEVEELERQLHAAFAVGDRVVQLLDQRSAAALQALDDHELPEGTGAIERIGGDQRGEVEQLTVASRLGEGDAAHVEVDVEIRIVHPDRSAHVAGRRLHPLAQSRDPHHRALHAPAEHVEIRLAIEDRDVGERRRQVGVLLEAPHEAFGVAHRAVVDDLGHQPLQRRGSSRAPPAGRPVGRSVGGWGSVRRGRTGAAPAAWRCRAPRRTSPRRPRRRHGGSGRRPGSCPRSRRS